MHPRSRHHSRYDLKQLTKICPELLAHVFANKYGDESVDFANPESVKLLNKAILMDSYGVTCWDIPENYLCPPVPGRADYLHYVSDVLATSAGGEIPRGPKVVGLDIGVGANCIYPLIGQFEYGWSFVGAEVDEVALQSAKIILEKNKKVNIELRHQKSSEQMFQGIIKENELFDFTMCNPPFHSSAEEAAQGTQRKLKNLGLKKNVLNFGGKKNELWCPGGEKTFIGQMIEESSGFADKCLWFTSLVSKSENIPYLENLLRVTRAIDVRVIDMSQGQKRSRILAWSFKDKNQQLEWATKRWI